MKWAFALAVFAIACAGCQNPSPVYNPFQSPTVVPPPGTAMPAAGQPYYGTTPAAPVYSAPASPPVVTPGTYVPPPASAPLMPARPMVSPGFAPAPAGGMTSSFSPNVSTSAAPATLPPMSAATPINGSASATKVSSAIGRPVYSAPGGTTYAQGWAAGPPTGVPTPTQPHLAQPPDQQPTLAQPTTTQQPTLAQQPTLMQQPTPAPSTPSNSSTSSVTPVSFKSPSSASPSSTIRIVEPSTSARIPELGDLPSASAMPATSIVASQSSSSASAKANPTAPATASANFGYDPQYHWLKGKLEYSQATGWRLRYIPPDGASDNYGGSVVLSDPAKLKGLQPGDLVYAEGTPGATSASSGSFAPLYTLQRIAKQ